MTTQYSPRMTSLATLVVLYLHVEFCQPLPYSHANPQHQAYHPSAGVESGHGGRREDGGYPGGRGGGQGQRAYGGYERKAEYGSERRNTGQSYETEDKGTYDDSETKYYYGGKFQGSCSTDGLYYRDDTTFVICSNGYPHEQPCPPGTKTSGSPRYQPGYYYGYTDLCSVNLVDYGYGPEYYAPKGYPENEEEYPPQYADNTNNGRYGRTNEHHGNGRSNHQSSTVVKDSHKAVQYSRQGPGGNKAPYAADKEVFAKPQGYHYSDHLGSNKQTTFHPDPVVYPEIRRVHSEQPGGPQHGGGRQGDAAGGPRYQ